MKSHHTLPGVIVIDPVSWNRLLFELSNDGGVTWVTWFEEYFTRTKDADLK